MRSRHGTEAHRWTDEEKAFLAEFVPGHSYLEVRDELERRFGAEVTVPAVKGVITRLGLRNGLSARVGRGFTPANKGKTWDEMGMSPEAQARSRATCFKPGGEPPNGEAVPIGTERVGTNGYVLVKTKRFSDRPGANKCWRAKHSLVWEEANRQPVPEGSVIAFADRDKRNFAPENLVCLSRGLMATIAKAGLAYHDRESLDAAVLTAKVIQTARDKELRERVCKTCGRTYKPYYKKQRRCRECIDARKG
ncbi:HNH endonuclease signature motif containing protein [Gordonibacter sp.]|uniref:HNH endonuclease signature motif containing protein n=1 Tax=Gordonibacter sp. TaxID=1968902 RepID=UPI002FCBA270